MPKPHIEPADRIAVPVTTAAVLLSCKDEQITAWIAAGALSSVMVGGMPRVWVHELRDLPQRLRELERTRAARTALEFKPELVRRKGQRA